MEALDIQPHERARLRRQFPGLGRKADHEGSRSAAIKLFCAECLGSMDASGCTAEDCFLWPYRPHGKNARADGAVPSIEDYRARGAEISGPGFD